MKRLTRQRLGVMVAIALTGVAITFVVWAVATTPGTRWLLTSVTRLSGISFSAQKIEGRISDQLLLTAIRITLAQQHLEIDRLELRWKPILLLTGSVAVEELTLNGVRIQDNSPPTNKPALLAWPQASPSASRFSARITQLRVTNFSYRRLQEEPVLVTSLAGSVTWQDGLLAIRELKAISPSGQINGAVSAGFQQPSLSADLVIAPRQPLAEMEQITLQVRHRSGTHPEPFIGTLTVVGSAGTRQLLELSAEVEMAQNTFLLRQLRLTRPGQKGLVTAEGSLTFASVEPLLTLQVKATDLDLAAVLNVPTKLSGTLTFTGTKDNYAGNFILANQGQGWQVAALSAAYQGTREGLKMTLLNVMLLDGALAGKLEMNWRDGLTLQGAIRGNNLNPARINPDWQGVANFTASGKVAMVGNTPLSGSVSAALLESRLHGQTLTGELRADFADNNLILTRLALQGKGFDLHAAGELKQRLTLSAQISDFSRLVPGSSGKLQAGGWVRWRDGQVSGAVTATGNKLAYAGTQIAAANLTAQLEQGSGYPLHITASLQDVLHAGYPLQEVKVAAEGTLARHSVSATLRSAGNEAGLTLSAGYSAGLWEGEISRLTGRDKSGRWKLTAPAAFAVSAGNFSLSPLTLTAGAAERLEFAADLTLNPLLGQLRAQWSGLNLARANPWLKDIQISGSSYGTVRINFLSAERLTLTGRVGGGGTLTRPGHSITLQQSLLTFDGSEEGMRSRLEFRTAGGGTGKGTFSSPAPLRRLSMPEQGELTAELSGIDVALLNPWLPDNTQVAGRISGQAIGRILPGQHFALEGKAGLSAGKLQQTRPDGELNLTIPSATATWRWQGEKLAGNLSLTLAEHGQVRADFQLPVAARFPVAIHSQGPLQGTLSGKFQEKGMITLLFPGLIQESSGELDAEFTLSGSWDEPVIGGMLRLAKANAYLPTAGIHLKDIQLTARLQKNLIHIDSFRAVSGPGYIEGKALITLAGWQVMSYQGNIRGENFQAVYLPELQILSTPELSFTGTPKKLTLRGELRLPELHIVGAPSRTVIAPSSDVIREGRVGPSTKSSPLALDIQIRLLLGKQVYVKLAGIDAQLGGAMDLSLDSLDRITSRGEIRVVKGRYRTYGVTLEIVRGRLFFTGGPINSPTLDFLALRTIGEVRAGVTVAGTLQKPITKLYSEPVMPDVDVVAYIVLGHPLGSSGEQANLVARAAGALLTSGEGEVVQEQLKNRFGLSTLEIQDGVGGTKGSMGYKPLSVSAPGTMPTAQQPGITQTMLTVGKYLTPQLYISYGKSLFTGSNLFRLRYDISRKWQIETETGNESGADLFYKLEFN